MVNEQQEEHLGILSLTILPRVDYYSPCTSYGQKCQDGWHALSVLVRTDGAIGETVQDPGLNSETQSAFCLLQCSGWRQIREGMQADNVIC